MKLRTLIFWPHLIAGVLAGIVILLMSVTGVLLTYERQLIAWSDSHLRSTPPSGGAPRLPIETVLGNLRRTHPEIAPTAVTINAAPDAPVMLAVPERTLYADAYTGALLGEGTRGTRELMSDLRAWHRWIAVEGEGRLTARAITGWSNVIFLFIVVSGMYLWLPKKWAWTNVKAVMLFRRTGTSKARDFNWHNVFGIWSAIPLFIVVISAVPISFPWGNAFVYRAVGEEVPRPAGREGGPGGREGGAGARGGGPGRAGGPAAEAHSRRAAAATAHRGKLPRVKAPRVKVAGAKVGSGANAGRPRRSMVSTR